MNGATRSRPQTERRKDRKSPFFLIGSEIAEVFLPIIGRDCFTIYAYLVSRHFKNPELEHSILGLKEVTGMGTSTVCRSLEIPARLGLIQLIRRGGSQKSKCRLPKTEEVAERLGAIYQKSELSWSLPKEAKQCLQARIEAIRQRQQGKGTKRASNACGNGRNLVSQRNAGVPLEKRQRVTRETQTGSNLLREEVRSKENSETQKDNGKDKSSPDEDEPDGLKWARAKFVGAINEWEDWLFDTSRRPVPYLANGAADAQKFGFKSLAVEAARRRGDGLVLTLSANNPAAARDGLDKYRKSFSKCLRKWFGCEVDWEIQ